MSKDKSNLQKQLVSLRDNITGYIAKHFENNLKGLELLLYNINSDRNDSYLDLSKAINFRDLNLYLQKTKKKSTTFDQNWHNFWNQIFTISSLDCSHNWFKKPNHLHTNNKAPCSDELKILSIDTINALLTNYELNLILGNIQLLEARALKSHEEIADLKHRIAKLTQATGNKVRQTKPTSSKVKSVRFAPDTIEYRKKASTKSNTVNKTRSLPILQFGIPTSDEEMIYNDPSCFPMYLPITNHSNHADYPDYAGYPDYPNHPNYIPITDCPNLEPPGSFTEQHAQPELNNNESGISIIQIMRLDKLLNNHFEKYELLLLKLNSLSQNVRNDLEKILTNEKQAHQNKMGIGLKVIAVLVSAIPFAEPISKICEAIGSISKALEISENLQDGLKTLIEEQIVERSIDIISYGSDEHEMAITQSEEYIVDYIKNIRCKLNDEFDNIWFKLETALSSRQNLIEIKNKLQGSHEDLRALLPQSMEIAAEFDKWNLSDLTNAVLHDFKTNIVDIIKNPEELSPYITYDFIKSIIGDEIVSRQLKRLLTIDTMFKKDKDNEKRFKHRPRVAQNTCKKFKELFPIVKSRSPKKSFFYQFVNEFKKMPKIVADKVGFRYKLNSQFTYCIATPFTANFYKLWPHLLNLFTYAYIYAKSKSIIDLEKYQDKLDYVSQLFSDLESEHPEIKCKNPSKNIKLLGDTTLFIKNWHNEVLKDIKKIIDDPNIQNKGLATNNETKPPLRFFGHEQQNTASDDQPMVDVQAVTINPMRSIY